MPTPASFVEYLKRLPIRVYDLKELPLGSWRGKLFDDLVPSFDSNAYPGGDSFLNLLDLAEKQLNARTAILEPYVSTDWNEEYSALYSRTFVDISRRAARLHFFRAPVSQLGYEQLYQLPKKVADSYVGYTVLRPIEAFRLGDTVLSSPCAPDPTDFDRVHCLAPFSVSLLGNPLTVTGMPFLQQDTSVGVCAESDLWMVARFHNARGDVRRYRLAEITSLATHTFSFGPPRDGLRDQQIVDALNQMGLQPDPLLPAAPEEAKEYIYTCIESGLPVIAGIPEHVVVVIGHDYDMRVFNKKRGKYRSMGEAVNAFIVHDDASGPYRSMTTGASGGLLTIGGEMVDFCVAAFPPRLNLRWQDVKDVAAPVWLDSMNARARNQFDSKKSFVADLNDLVLRGYLRLSRSFKEDLLRPDEDLRRHPAVIAAYRAMQMPKYVWVVELCQRQDLLGVAPKDRLIRGELVFDSTGNRHLPDQTLMAFYYEGSFFAPGLVTLQVPQRPYRPMLRRIPLPQPF